MKKRITTTILTLLMLFCCTTAAFANEGLGNFKKVNDYVSGQFKDVANGKWYTENIKTAYELGLMKGSGAMFNLNGNITLAETLAIACRIHDTYYGGTEAFEQGSPWYQVYVDYAIEHDIIRLGEYSGYTLPATRAQFVSLLDASVPPEALVAINDIQAIPDVSGTESYGESAYRFYQAGVLTGSDKYGTFNPESNISRSEVSAIVTRIVATSLRKVFILEEKPVAVTGITISKTALNLMVGDSAALTAQVYPDNAADQNVTWSSSDPSVASVTNGTVRAVGIGTATISAQAGGKKAACTVTVSKREQLNQSQVSIRLKIPRNGTLNYYAELVVTNNSSDTITMPSMLGINGYLCNHYSTASVASGTSATVAYYRAPISSQKFDDKNCNMYLDNNSTGYAVMVWKGEQYYAEYGVNGITVFYRGNVNGPT